jgi:predicted RNase H-like HicB family nuclease
MRDEAMGDELPKGKDRYLVRFESDEEKRIVAQIPEIPGCHTQGRTVPEALRRLREALGLFIANATDVDLAEDLDWRDEESARGTLRAATSGAYYCTAYQIRGGRWCANCESLCPEAGAKVSSASDLPSQEAAERAAEKLLQAFREIDAQRRVAPQ